MFPARFVSGDPNRVRWRGRGGAFDGACQAGTLRPGVGVRFFAEFVFEHGSVCGFIVVGVTPNEWGHPVHLQSCEWCDIVRECIE